jgi:hypothetical protein
MVREQVDGEGFRPVPRGAKICEIPVKSGGLSQRERKAAQNVNRFTSLADLDDDDDPDGSTSTTVPRVAPTIVQRVNKAKPAVKENFDQVLAEFSEMDKAGRASDAAPETPPRTRLWNKKEGSHASTTVPLSTTVPGLPSTPNHT